MRLFSRKRDTDPEGLERAKQAEARADQRLRESKATSRWVREVLNRQSAKPDELTSQLIKILGGHA